MQFTECLELSDLLGDGEPFVTPLLGKTKDQLGRLHPRPPRPRQGRQDRGLLLRDQRRALSDQEGRDRQLLETKYGKGTERKDGNIVLEKAKPEIHIRYDDIIHEWTVNVERPFL